ncbi:MAG: dicarboxylate/amino acid:cation symporter [Waddliaceae bacterium]
MKNHPLIKVFAAMILAVIAGLLAGPDAAIGGVAWVRVFDLIGNLFLNALTLVVVPLIVSSIITGVGKLGTQQAFGQLGIRTLLFFLLTAVLAVLVGLIVSLSFSPGASLDHAPINFSFKSVLQVEQNQEAGGGVFAVIENLLFRIVPSNIISTASEGQILGLILFSLLFGLFMSKLETNLAAVMIDFWKGVFEIMMQMTRLIMRALPVGVFGLMATIVATTGFESIKPVVLFMMTVLLGLGVYLFAVLPFLLKVVGKVNPAAHFSAVIPALVTAFSTSSTAATLPVTLDCMEKRAGIPNRICSFILSLGISMNLTGSALYATCAVLFIAQASGVAMTPPVLFTVFLMGVFSAMGMVAGVPSGSLITVVVMVQTLGISSSAVVLIVAVDRILDMCRTTVSVYTNTCCTSLVYAGINEEDAGLAGREDS